MSSNNSSQKNKLKEKLTKKYGTWITQNDINMYTNMNKSSNEILNSAYNQSYRAYQLYLTKELLPSILKNLKKIKSSPECPTELGKKGNSIRLRDLPGILISIYKKSKTTNNLNEETLRRRLQQHLLARTTGQNAKQVIINTLSKANMKGLRNQQKAARLTKNNLKSSLKE
tara:strand:+ start:1137 stop:1649 length:513 start_codon:yes stop_codon:yes gene_type:complete